MKRIFDYLNSHYEEVVLILMALCLCFIFASCGSSRTTTEARESEHVEKVDYSNVIDSIYKAITSKDSIYVHDSVFVKEKADTLYIYKEKNVIRYITSHDTIYKVHCDTIRIKEAINKQHTDKVVKERVTLKSLLGHVVGFLIGAAIGLVIVYLILRYWRTSK